MNKRALRVSFSTLALLVSLPNCVVRPVRHEPGEALIISNKFLSALYYDGDYKRAFQYVDSHFKETASIDDLHTLVLRIKQERGNLQAIRTESYLIVPGSGMQLFYVGTYDRGMLYHRVAVSGDASSGYQIAGVWYSTDPYPRQSLRRDFEDQIVIRDETNNAAPL
jgi:hypothetical protein